MQDATLCQRKFDHDPCIMDGSLGRHRKDINASCGQVNALVDRVVTLEEEIVEAKKVNRRLECKVSTLEVITDDQAVILEDVQAKIAHLEGRMCNCVSRPGAVKILQVVEEMESDEDDLGYRTDQSFLTPPSAPSIPPYVDGVRAESVEDITFFEEDVPVSQVAQTCGCLEEEKVVVAEDFMTEILEGNKENEILIMIPAVRHRHLLMDFKPVRYNPYRCPLASSCIHSRGTIEGCSKFISNRIRASVPINSRRSVDRSTDVARGELGSAPRFSSSGSTSPSVGHEGVAPGDSCCFGICGGRHEGWGV